MTWTFKTFIIFFFLCISCYADVIEFEPIAEVSGYINHTGFSYTGYEDVDGAVGKNTASGSENATFMSYDTSALTIHDVVTQIVLKIDVGVCSSGTPPSSWVNTHSLGHAIVDGELETDEVNIWKGLNGEAGGWIEAYSDSPPGDGDQTICATQASCHEFINKDGITDWAIFDESLYFLGGDWTCSYEIDDTRFNSEIEVTYTRGGTNNAVINNAIIAGEAAKGK